MAKALSIYGQDQLYTSDGRQIDWRKEFATKLIEKQKGDGLWVNDNGRWMENDPVLATSYSLIAMNLVLPHL
jgi:squalene-hopene/tetraprenyl-beta-curcumene cyclase